MPLRGIINIIVTLGVIGVMMLLLRLLFPTFAEFVTYIYIAIVFALALFTAFSFLPRRAISFITRAAIFGILLGMAGMIQPFTAALFKWSFFLLLASTVTYSVVS